MWMSYPFSEKMIGCGTDCFFLQMVPVYGQEMMDLFEEVFADAHCEFLQLLVTTGLIGVAGYFGFWSGILIAVWRKMKEIPALLICLASICAYMVQGFLNNLVPACVPLIFVFAAISKNISLSSES
jgi:O-antigen ligase